ncbi:MAG: hypothetical protein CMQ61_12330 [Gammaproteobacteria bacterium]|nr:hypothetical protein [Gammaproteobacteria bacterium]
MASSADVGDDTSAPKPQDVLCACQNATIGDLQRVVWSNPGVDFEQVLERTQMGNRCTACLLDLEHYFVEFSAARPKNAHIPATAEKPIALKLPLKQRFYRVIDNLMPLMPVRLEDVLPVIVGPDIEQWVIVANQSLLYEDEFKAPSMQVVADVFDGEGRPLGQLDRTLASGETLRTNLTDMLAPEGLTIGSVTIKRRALTPGYRGTTRPQMEIVTSRASCAVHGQAVGPRKSGDIVLSGNGDSDQRFLALVSRDSKPARIELRYPLPLHAAPDHGDATEALVIPPYGARLIRLKPVAAATLDESEGLLRLSWVGTGVYTSHLVLANHALDRFSVDHV